jgi:hypothetical protein
MSMLYFNETNLFDIVNSKAFAITLCQMNKATDLN